MNSWNSWSHTSSSVSQPDISSVIVMVRPGTHITWFKRTFLKISVWSSFKNGSRQSSSSVFYTGTNIFRDKIQTSSAKDSNILVYVSPEELVLFKKNYKWGPFLPINIWRTEIDLWKIENSQLKETPHSV